VRYKLGVTRDELEAIRARLEAARKQWLPAGGGMRVVAIQFASGYGPNARIVVFGCDESFSLFLLAAREDVEELLKVIEEIISS
jgi:hypothetical protein